MTDIFYLGDKAFTSRFILGSGKFSLPLIRAVTERGGAEMITLALRRANPPQRISDSPGTPDPPQRISDSPGTPVYGGEENILDFIPPGVTLIPNTSGARTAEEAVRIARLSRALGCGDFVKVEIMRDTKYLLPENHETVKATEMLVVEGFQVLPYVYPDLATARALVAAGAAAVMPLGAPIGSNRGLLTREFIRILVEEIDLPIIVDAGIGRPSHACEAMELGAAAVMANTAIATADDPAAMALAFRLAIEAGRQGWLAGAGRVLERGAEATSPLTGFLED